jgi:hypothetical protein
VESASFLASRILRVAFGAVRRTMPCSDLILVCSRFDSLLFTERASVGVVQSHTENSSQPTSQWALKGETGCPARSAGALPALPRSIHRHPESGNVHIASLNREVNP